MPSHPQPSTSKRKSPEDANSIQPIAKKARKEGNAKAGKSTKRKLVGEAKPGGLVIIRAPPTRANHAQSSNLHTSDTTSQPSSQTPSSSTSTPNDSTQPTSKRGKSDNAPSSRRTGKGKDRELTSTNRSEPEVDEDVRQMQSEADDLRRRSRSEASVGSLDQTIQFPSSRPPRTPSHERIHDASHPIPLQETPQIEKNKIMRGETGHRRRSSVSRGKRASSSFENTGVITQPHTSVADSAFYKHIDVELPEPQRAQQLLIWCSHRAVGELTEKPPNSTSGKGSKAAGKDPPLSKADIQLLKGVQDDVIRMLAEKKVDTNVFSPSGDGTSRSLKPNEQNVKNRARESRFNAHIQKLKQEQEAWTEVGSFYKSMLSEVEKREKEISIGSGKGKQRATLEDIASWNIDGRDLPEHFQGEKGIRLAVGIIREESGRKNPLSERMEDLELTTDRLHGLSQSALETTWMAQADLDRRFALLHGTLASRSQPILPAPPTSTVLLSSFLPVATSRTHSTDPQDLLPRRAAREVQRAKDASVGLAERRLTGVLPPTPRKPPGTPRRATTPGRGR
ncbi:hypothetical protein NLI96_g5606 [Meripilus lineatus]|uniref:Uncharacterized protein n=1 Tax=Meripilus lineatus TaxID=2056292 RepID=A0AAD5V371_9APHY|nr:hypothetical protein NLI96_g5606 [Physisporinus lineatus]